MTPTKAYWIDLPGQLAADECVETGHLDRNAALHAAARSPRLRRVALLTVSESVYPDDDPRFDPQPGERWCVIVSKEQ